MLSRPPECGKITIKLYHEPFCITIHFHAASYKILSLRLNIVCTWQPRILAHLKAEAILEILDRSLAKQHKQYCSNLSIVDFSEHLSAGTTLLTWSIGTIRTIGQFGYTDMLASTTLPLNFTHIQWITCVLHIIGLAKLVFKLRGHAPGVKKVFVDCLRV